MSDNNFNFIGSFIEKRFPEDIGAGSLSCTEYWTDVAIMHNAYEQRNINWLQPRMRFQIARGLKDQGQIEQLISFFRICRGRAIGFRFKDWSDYRAENQILAIGDGKKQAFQLIKTYRIGEINEKRFIRKPIASSIQVFIDKRPLSLKEFEINTSNGMLNLAQPLPVKSTLSANFEFDVPARFDSDMLPLSIEGEEVYLAGEIAIIEIKC
jgi:uncharacterized protein (TIGR02217 family)